MYISIGRHTQSKAGILSSEEKAEKQTNKKQKCSFFHRFSKHNPEHKFVLHSFYQRLHTIGNQVKGMENRFLPLQRLE